MKNFLLLLICFFSFYINAQEYIKNIKGEVLIKGSFDSKSKVKSAGTMFIYETEGNDSFILDSAKVRSGQFVFKKRIYETGVYKLAYNNMSNSLDFIVNSAESKKINFEINNVRIKKGYDIIESVENKIKKLYTVKEESITQKLKLIRKSKKSRDEKIAEMSKLQSELYDYGLQLHNQHPGTYFGMILSKMKSPQTYISHLYFNDIDFTDNCIVRSTLLPTRIQDFFQNHSNWPNNKFGFHDAIDVVMEHAKVNDEVAEFCMYNMLDGFYNTGQTDKKNNPVWTDLCNYIMDNYIFGEGCGDDVQPSELLKERAFKFKNLQLGSKPPNFTILDLKNNNIDLAKTCSKNNFTVLMFWASHCQHCMAELPGFAKWYDQNKNGNFEIIAISLDGNTKNWQNAVNNNNFSWINICEFKVYKSPICLDYKIKKTPTFFVLNNAMEIVAKPRSTHQLRSFLLSNK
ncbi:MAG: hypothetical protein CMP49_03420 [Flavobacteriales bacterium]|jgi:thiol-disulfide isomerase/thioredoxin|nr:hypothetical protein [Flavobacteriales bacterium]|tara:strand:- start:53 stop:1429 length:1377 start_codon:yes stop_codon:yes gene_type:complete